MKKPKVEGSEGLNLWLESGGKKKLVAANKTVSFCQGGSLATLMVIIFNNLLPQVFPSESLNTIMWISVAIVMAASLGGFFKYHGIAVRLGREYEALKRDDAKAKESKK